MAHDQGSGLLLEWPIALIWLKLGIGRLAALLEADLAEVNVDDGFVLLFECSNGAQRRVGLKADEICAVE